MNDPVIVTGQQIGLLGGPLYTTYKVLGAVALARQENGSAVFWLETNDADFAEINNFSYLDKENNLKSLHWKLDSGGFSCGLIPVDEQLVEVLNTFFNDIPQTEFTEELSKLALSCYQPGKTLGEASVHLAAALYRGLGVQIFDPSDKSFLKEIRPILEAEVAATRTGNQCNAFLRVNGKRLALFKTESGLVFRDKNPADLQSGQLLPNLKTRNVCQDGYFHTNTYVAGPGEISYISSLDPFYDRYNIQKARVQRRMSAILVESRTRRLLDRSDMTVAEITAQSREALLKQVQNRESGVDFSTVKTALAGKTEEYLNAVEDMGLDRVAIGKALAPAAKAALGKKRAEINQSVGQKLADVGELYDRLFPFGKPQERCFNLFYFMNRYGGLSFIQWILDRHQFESQILEVYHA